MTISGSEPMRPTRRSVLFGIALAGLPLPAFAGSRTRLSGRAFGTTWTVISAVLRDPVAITDRIRTALTAIDTEMSPFLPDSVLSRFNTGLRTISVSVDFEHVTRAALAVAATSGGACDPSVGPAVHRYGFGPIRGTFRAGAWQAIRCEGGQLTADAPVTLDLCGIAKGFAVDKLTDILAQETDDFIVEIGGEIRAYGNWPVGILNPLTGSVHSRIRLSSNAVATSGDAINGFDHGGRRWSHVIDPATGKPVANGIASVSVIAPDAMGADAMATALMVMGENQGIAFAEAQNLGALFLIRDGNGLRARHNAAFAARLI